MRFGTLQPIDRTTTREGGNGRCPASDPGAWSMEHGVDLRIRRSDERRKCGCAL